MAIFGRRGLLKALPFAGVAALSAQPPMSRSLEDRLRTAIDKLEVLNTHEHTLPESERMAQAIDFFTLAGHYAINDLISAGLPAESLQVINNPEAPEAERWRRFEEYWKFARFTGYSEALRIAIRDIYGIDRISGATIGRINQAIRTRNRPGLYRYIFKERPRIRFSVLDDYWNIAPVRPDPEFFVLAHKFDRFVIPWTREDIARLEKATAMSIGSLRDLVRAMEENFRQNLAAGMVTVKTTLAYERELLFGEVSAGRAQPIGILVGERRPAALWIGRGRVRRPGDSLAQRAQGERRQGPGEGPAGGDQGRRGKHRLAAGGVAKPVR